MIVVDASVAAKWLLAEADSDIAFDFLDRHQSALTAPDLLAVEVSRALVTATNMQRIDRNAAVSRLQFWLKILDEGQIALHSSIAHLTTASDLAIDLGHPLPDCIYLALAQQLNCPLVTADGKFAARAISVYDRIVMLSDA